MKTIEKRSSRTLLAIVVTCFVTLLFSSASPIKKSDERPFIRRFVIICHQGKTMRVDEQDVKSHLLHGDGLGRCPEQILIKQD